MRYLLLCIFLALLFCGCSGVSKEEKPAIQCTVMKFEAGNGISEGEAVSVTDMFASALQNSGRFIVVERKKLDAVLQEQQFQATMNEANAVSAGRILAIRKMFTGSIGKLGENYVINLKMIDIETSKVDFAISKTYDDDLEDIGDDFIPELVKDVLKRIEEMR